MSQFKERHFRGEIVLWAVLWYCRYAVSYRDLEATMTERGVAVDPSTSYRWVQHFAPKMKKRLRWQWRGSQFAELAHRRELRQGARQVGVSVPYARRAREHDRFYLSATRNTEAVKRFLGKALRGSKSGSSPEVLNTDKAPAYGAAIAELKTDGKCPTETRSVL